MDKLGLQGRYSLSPLPSITTQPPLSTYDVAAVAISLSDLELLEGVSTKGKTEQLASYQVRKPSGKPKGYLSLSYKFGEKFSGKAEEPVTAYPPGTATGSSSAYAPPAGQYYPPPAAGYPPQTQAGYAYKHQQQPGYGGYPPPPPVYVGCPPQQGYGYSAVQQPPNR
ncbi:hypothetical protein L2E82_45525 [Cichorium intybus]|uniref:Uncharacterized protein n=1 Tax=Cichorium intybus TaxID=13427 RepID=A0ACB8ZU80_CICIN|nr:hypothetical protein L2E82_45525 [Cichorium intybus]